MSLPFRARETAWPSAARTVSAFSLFVWRPGAYEASLASSVGLSAKPVEPLLSGAKGFAHEAGFDEVGEAVLVRLDPGQNGFDFELVRRLHVATGGIGENLADQVARERIETMLGEDFSELVKARKSFT